MIRRATFRNFKALRDLSIDLERFTVLVGPNASGKSSILQGLDLLLGMRRQTPAQLFQPNFFTRSLFSRGGHGTFELEVTTETRGLLFRALPQTELAEEGTGAGGNSAWHFYLLTYDAASPDKSVEVHKSIRAWDEIPKAVLLRLDAKRMAAPSIAADQHPTIKADGEGLASALAYFALNQPVAFSGLKESLRSLFPFVSDVRFERVLMGQWAESLLFDFNGAPSVPAGQASDGTLLVLGLLAAVYQANSPQVLLLDDLDHALHPTAQRELARLLRALLADRPTLQIIATTHSPYMLDEFKPSEVRLTNRLPDGGVACATLADHPDFERWKDVMGAGEFWSMVGEKWIGQRAPEAIAP